MRVVVTGATGSIGTALLRGARERGAITSVAAVSRRGPGRLTPGPSGLPRPASITHHTHDLAAAAPGTPAGAALIALVAGADAVVHLAWANGRDADAVSRANRAITANVLHAVEVAHVPHLLLGSCASVYAPSYGATPRDETWAATGVPGSRLSADKVGAERLAAAFAARHPGTVVTVMRPAVTLQESAGASLVRLSGPLLPRFGLGRSVPVLVWPQDLGLQVIHADDVAAAYLAAIERRTGGTFNLAAPQVLDPEDVAAAIGARRVVALPRAAARGGHTAAWRLRLVSASPDWLETLSAAPVLDTSRARSRLGISPVRSAADVLVETARGVAARREGWTPALSREAPPPVR